MRRPRAAIALALAVATLAVYAPVLRHGFVDYDDDEYVFRNPHVRAGLTAEGIAWAFTSVESANWHPLTWLSHMLDCELFGLRPAGHHATNLVLHTLNVVLLFLTLARLTGGLWPSAAVGRCASGSSAPGTRSAACMRRHSCTRRTSTSAGASTGRAGGRGSWPMRSSCISAEPRPLAVGRPRSVRCESHGRRRR